MNFVRSTNTTYVAAFILGALVALALAAPARSAETMQLDRVGVVRFTVAPDGQLLRQNAVLHDNGLLHLRAAWVVPRAANTPDWVLGRNLIPVSMWHAYHALGFGALNRFELHDGGARVYLDDVPYLLIAPNFETPTAAGRLRNLSSRTRLATGSDVAISGFVVDDRPRVVLIRAVGPALQQFGVSSPLSDPFLSIKRNGVTIYFNDNWSAAGEADAIRSAAASVGAFPLEEGSRDAARLVELAPGGYTVHVESASPSQTGGEVLIEVYSVPADVLDDPAAL